MIGYGDGDGHGDGDGDEHSPGSITSRRLKLNHMYVYICTHVYDYSLLLHYLMGLKIRMGTGAQAKRPARLMCYTTSRGLLFRTKIIFSELRLTSSHTV